MHQPLFKGKSTYGVDHRLVQVFEQVVEGDIVKNAKTQPYAIIRFSGKFSIQNHNSS
jgi:hypothetical protein